MGAARIIFREVQLHLQRCCNCWNYKGHYTFPRHGRLPSRSTNYRACLYIQCQNTIERQSHSIYNYVTVITYKGSVVQTPSRKRHGDDSNLKPTSTLKKMITNPFISTLSTYLNLIAILQIPN